MPKLAEAAALVVGQIIHTEPSKVFGTNEVDGIRCLLQTGDGFAQVKIRTELADDVRPVPGQKVAWLLRYGATGGRERDASAYSTFVRIATPADLDNLAGVVRAPQQQKPAA